MKYWLTPFLLLIFFSFAKSQYFHETLDSYYNLRSVLSEDQKAKFGFKTYSVLHFENTIPNILDNFQVISRFKLTNKKYWLLNNSELGAGINGFITNGYDIPELYYNTSILVKLYSDKGKNFIITPVIQYIKIFQFNETGNSKMQLGLAGRYNIMGDDFYYNKTFPVGYDLSVLFNYEILTLQLMHSANSIYTSYTFNTSELEGFAESDKNRLSIPGDFQNLSFFTIAFGDYYLCEPADKKDLMYNIYLSIRKIVPSEKDLRSEDTKKQFDFITGFRVLFKKFTINPEYMVNKTKSSLKLGNYSIMTGYDFGRLQLKAGFSHGIYIFRSVDLYSLQEENIHHDKLIIAFSYTLK